MFILKCILSLGIIGAIIILALYLFPKIRVDGASMYPTYEDGEVVRGCRLLRKSLKVGDVYVYYRTDKENGSRYIVIKRLTKMIYNKSGEVKLFFTGDNRGNSTDSRKYGYIDPEDIIAKVLNPRKNKFIEGDNINEIRKDYLKSC